MKKIFQFTIINAQEQNCVKLLMVRKRKKKEKKMKLTFTIRGRKYSFGLVLSRISGGNQQICLAAKERSYCEEGSEKPFKTSETYQVEKVGSIFLSSLFRLPRSFSTFKGNDEGDVKIEVLWQKTLFQFPR